MRVDHLVDVVLFDRMDEAKVCVMRFIRQTPHSAVRLDGWMDGWIAGLTVSCDIDQRKASSCHLCNLVKA